MIRHVHVSRGIGLMALLAATAFVDAGAQQPARDSVLAFYRAWSSATAAEGPAGYARFFATDARLVPQGDSAVVGRDSIRAWAERTPRASIVAINPDSTPPEDITFAGSYAMVIIMLRGHRTPEGGGEAVAVETKYIDVLHRASTGYEVAYRTWTEVPRAADPPE
jgi:ketosteroid isomerase-like protein